jgi:hypothetical protein
MPGGTTADFIDADDRLFFVVVVTGLLVLPTATVLGVVLSDPKVRTCLDEFSLWRRMCNFEDNDVGELGWLVTGSARF